MQQSVKRYHPGCALTPTGTVTCILLYIGHSDNDIVIHMRLPLLLEVSVSLPLDSNNIHGHNFLANYVEACAFKIDGYNWSCSGTCESY